MSKRISISVAALAIFAVVGVFALDVLKPDAAGGAQFVAARKAAMQANAANVGDVRAKSSADNVKAAVANARSIAVAGAFIPLAFTQTYADSYPAGSPFFFKGGSMDDFAAKAQALANAADALGAAAEKGDKAAVDAQVGALFGACGACHAVFRGSR